MKKNVNELVFWQKCYELEDGDAAAPSSTFHSRITVAMTSNKQKHILELFSRSIVKISKISDEQCSNGERQGRQQQRRRQSKIVGHRLFCSKAIF